MSDPVIHWESKYKACRAAFLATSRMNAAERKILVKREQRLKQWIRDGLMVDGAHHKQYFLQRMAIEVGVELETLVRCEQGIAP